MCTSERSIRTKAAHARRMRREVAATLGMMLGTEEAWWRGRVVRGETGAQSWGRWEGRSAPLPSKSAAAPNQLVAQSRSTWKMVAAIDDIVAATCRRRLPRCRRMRAACRSAGGSRRQRRITGRSPLPPRASTAASAAAPTTSATIVARRPLSRPAARPRRPEPAPAGDRSHRRVDAGRVWVELAGGGNPTETSGCYLKIKTH